MYIYIYVYRYSVCIEYTYSWPTFNGALVAEMSPNSVFWSLFFKIFLGGHASRPPSFHILGVLCTPLPSKGPLFLEKNLPTLSSAYGPVIGHQSKQTSGNGFHSTLQTSCHFTDIMAELNKRHCRGSVQKFLAIGCFHK